VKNKKSEAVVATLCEGSYWHGVATLFNSLVVSGFRGYYCIGYKGEIPAWFKSEILRLSDDNNSLNLTLPVIELFPLSTGRHLTNFKADFLRLLRDKYKQGDYFAYFDPDIVVKATWSFFERWMMAGVALCEDVNSSVSVSHPLRKQWIEYFDVAMPIEAQQLQSYINAGFCGVQSQKFEFIEDWKRFQDIAEGNGFSLDSWGPPSREHIFSIADQDFLNFTAMFHADKISLVGKDGMGFVHGGYIMFHAIGARKPWKGSYLQQILLEGVRPREADRLYWKNASGPLRAHPPEQVWWAQWSIKIASAIGRVYSRAGAV
jgi:hypothetical protein